MSTSSWVLSTCLFGITVGAPLFWVDSTWETVRETASSAQEPNATMKLQAGLVWPRARILVDFVHLVSIGSGVRGSLSVADFLVTRCATLHERLVTVCLIYIILLILGAFIGTAFGSLLCLGVCIQMVSAAAFSIILQSLPPWLAWAFRRLSLIMPVGFSFFARVALRQLLWLLTPILVIFCTIVLCCFMPSALAALTIASSMDNIIQRTFSTNNSKGRWFMQVQQPMHVTPEPAEMKTHLGADTQHAAAAAPAAAATPPPPQQCYPQERGPEQNVSFLDNSEISQQSADSEQHRAMTSRRRIATPPSRVPSHSDSVGLDRECTGPRKRLGLQSDASTLDVKTEEEPQT